jgi:coenzyme F420 hydrogenase subunit beta
MIKDVVRRGLCTQCCFCAALCPTAAVAMERDAPGNLFPRVDPAACTECGLCLEICSGRAFPFAETSGDPNGGEIGECRGLLTAHAADGELRRRAASGGVASTLLAGALEAGLARRALVVAMPDRGWQAEARLVSSPVEIRAAAGSWYLPVRCEGAIREVARGRDPVVVAGLPCHIQAWRKAAARIPGLEEKVALTVGLFCDHLVDERFWRLLLERHGIDADPAAGISFRGDGWPGKIRVRLGDGRVQAVPYDTPLRKVLWKSYLYTPRRCLYCYDALAEFADLSVGDPWLPEFAGDSLGRNIVVVRSARGGDLVERLSRAGALVTAPLAGDRLRASQRVQLAMKKREIGARVSLARSLGRAVPEWGVALPRPSLRGWMLGAGALAISSFSRSRLGPLAGSLPWRTMAAIYRRRRKAA